MAVFVISMDAVNEQGGKGTENDFTNFLFLFIKET